MPGGLVPLTEYLADDYELGARIAAAGFRVELSDEIVETSIHPWNLSGYLHHQLRWARTMRESRRAGYAGLVFSYGLAWAFLNLIASGLSLPAFALFTLALLFRVSLALGVGVGILRDRQVLRDLWLLLPRDLLALAVWAWSYASDTISWRDQRFLLQKGKVSAARLERDSNHNGARQREDCEKLQCVGGTYSFGSAAPSPKKNCSICSTRNSCACGVHGCSRYSFSSIFCRSTHSCHAFFDTLL